MNVTTHQVTAAVAAPSGRKDHYREFLLLVVLFAAGVRLWRSPWSASDLRVVPDSLEYAIGAQRLVTLGHYDIEIEGATYPPRYPPWFSLLLAPAYALAPRELGVGIVPVLLFALCALAAAFVIGNRLAGEWGAVGSALALASYGEFRRGSMRIMADVPAAAFALWACVLYLRLRRGDGRTTTWLLAGALCAAAFALRLELLPLCAPFLVLALEREKAPFARTILFSAPIVMMALASALYNYDTFGSWRRTGYQFWLPNLYRDLARILSPGFIPVNVATLVSFWGLTAVGFGSIGAWKLLARGSSEARALLALFFFGALPGSVFHLFYFWQDLRFHLLSLAILCILAGAGLVTFLGESLRQRARLLLPVITLCTIALPESPEPEPRRRIVAEALARETPSDAVIVSALETAYLEPTVLRGTTRRVVPYDRSVEYCGRMVMIEWLDASRFPIVARSAIPPNESSAMNSPGVAPVCTFAADEDPQRIAAWVRSGVPVYLDASFIVKGFPIQRLLGDDLELVPSTIHPWLSRYALRK